MKVWLLTVLFFILPTSVRRAYIRRAYRRLLADPNVHYATKVELDRVVKGAHLD